MSSWTKAMREPPPLAGPWWRAWRPPCLHMFSFASQSLLISEHCCSAGWLSLDPSPLKRSNYYTTSLRLLQPSPSYPLPQSHTHSHRVSLRERQIMVLLVLSLCQQEVNCLKDGKLSKARSVDIYPIVLLVLAPRKVRSAPFLMTEVKKKKLRRSHWPCFQPWEESLSAVKERERKMLSFRMQKKREESILPMVIGVSLLFLRLGWILDLSEDLAALI